MRDIQKVGCYGQAQKIHRFGLFYCILCRVIAVYGVMIQLAGFSPDTSESTQVSGISGDENCLNICAPLFPVDASELLSTTLEYQAKLLEESKESKKRKRDAPHQPIRPKSTSASSLSPNRNSLENQSPTDALSFSPTISYSQPAHEIMTPDPPIIQSTWPRLTFSSFLYFDETLLSRLSYNIPHY